MVVICAFTVAHTASAFAGSEREVTSVQVKEPLGVGSIRKANAELEKAVRAKLDSHEEIKRAGLSIQADVTRNQITLSGTVASEAMRAKALELARSAHAGVIVSDKIDVKSRAANSLPVGTNSRLL
jgi:osmotically-inducible protein OsmY